jgi:hypothetical protein
MSSISTLSESVHSKLLSLHTYRLYEKGHPGFKEDVSGVITRLEVLKAKKGEALSILELGAGPGTTLTQELGKKFADKGDTVFINDIEPEAVALLKESQRAVFDEKSYVFRAVQESESPYLSAKLKIEEPQGVIKWMEHAIARGIKLDAIVSNGTLHHIQPKYLPRFFELAGKILNPGGQLINGEEHIDYTIAPDMLKLLGIENAHEQMAFARLSMRADQLVLPYQGESTDNALIAKYNVILAESDTKKALQKLGIPADVRPLELLKYIRPAAVVSHHFGTVIARAWTENKLKLPAMEYEALISGLETCDDFFKQMHQVETTQNDDPGKYNRIAARLMGALTQKLREHPQQTDNTWESVEPGATQNGRVTEAESRKAVLEALVQLQKLLESSPVVGVPLDTQALDPDIRYEGDRKLGGNMRDHSPVDYKIHPLELAKVAAQHGFCMELERNMGHQDREAKYGVTRRSNLSSPGSGSNSIKFKLPELGGMCVTTARRASEVKEEMVIAR